MSPAAFRSVLACLALGLVYGAAAALAILVGRVDQGVSFVWVATAILTSRLSSRPPRAWPGAIAACFLASVLTTGALGFGWRLALPLAFVNIGEALFGAWMLRRLNGSFDPLKSLRWVGGFLVALGLFGPAAGAIGAAAVVALVVHQDPVVTAVRWYLGHALGTITFAPVLLLIFQTRPRTWAASIDLARAPEAVGLIGLVLVTTVVAFGQTELPLLFLPTLPIILATFRLGRGGASVSIVILAVIGSIMTLRGVGPLTLIGPMGIRLQMLQFYLAATVMTILPVAAELAYRGELFRRLRESEARYRLVADNSTDIILNVDLEGVVRVASPSIQPMGGYAPEDIVGKPALGLIAPDYHGDVIRAHYEVLAYPQRNVIVEYRAVHANGELRWYESHTRAVLDEHNAVIGSVSAVRDIAHRKLVEGELAVAAYTDQLTGLANRRAFLAEFDRRAARANAHGCVAMLDLDHFKRVNDVHGHDAGDEVLRRFAAVARGCLRDGDMLARIGGEEFALLLPGAGLTQAQIVCDRIRRAIGTAPTSYGGMALLVTVSGGVAAWTAGADRQATLREADIALYRAKREGRNRLALAS